MPTNATPARETARQRDHSETAQGSVAEKWGCALDAGYQVIPSVLIQAQSRLGLDAVDCMILLNLNLHWWRKYDLPYPRPALIAKRMGVSRRTIERRLFKLQKMGWLRRLPADTDDDGQRMARRYDLSGMVRRLQDAAIIGVNQREYRARSDS